MKPVNESVRELSSNETYKFSDLERIGGTALADRARRLVGIETTGEQAKKGK